MTKIAPAALLAATTTLVGAVAASSSAGAAPAERPVASSLLLTPAEGRTTQIDPPLAAAMDAAAPDESVSALVYLIDAVDLVGLDQFLVETNASRHERHLRVVTALRDAAARSQPDVLEAIDAIGADAALTGGRIDRVDPFWIANVIRIDATPDVIERVAALPAVDRAFFNNPITHTAPVDEQPEIDLGGGGGEEDGGDQSAILAGAIEPGVLAVNADDAWALGFDGAGALVAVVDTGVDGNHPALASRWRGLDPAYAGNPQWAWFDPYSGDNSFPFDGGFSGHGTHVAGSVMGGLPGDQVGVAPGAEWIAASAIDQGGGIPETVADAIETFEWLIDPDGDPATLFDVPDVCTNSWGLLESFGYPLCDDLFWSYLDALEFAGTIVTFAAGNEGFAEMRRPADRATDNYRTFAVAAVDGNQSGWPVASFSSRGPTFCTFGGGSATKPEIAAPGVDVRSAAAGGGYSFKSGTSMATPHVAGVMALVRGANPALSVQQVKQIVFDTAFDLGAPGDDNDYGHGMIDAFEAVQAALATVGVSFEYPNGRPEFVVPAGGTTVAINVESQAAAPLPDTGRLFYRTDGGPWQDVAMTEVAAGAYEATFPALPCGASVDWYVSVDADSGDTFYSPYLAPGTFWNADAYAGDETVMFDDFETDMGWTVENVALEDGAWSRGVPVGGGDRGDPAEDADGSGACWLTDNVDGNSDVDGGPTRLISPIYDLAGLDGVELRYSRWFSADDNDADALVVEISNDGGQSWVLVESTGSTDSWVEVAVLVEDYVALTDQMRLRFSATDNPNDSVTEAAIDGLSFGRLLCGDDEGIPGDLDGDGVVGIADLLELLAAWGPCDGCPADLDGDGAAGFGDLVILLGAWTS